MTTQRIGFLIWPSTRPLTLALAEEVLRVAQRVHPDVLYELAFLQADASPDGDWRLPGEPWNGRLEGCHKLFLLADEPPSAMGSALSAALKQLARSGCMIGGLSAGVYPLAALACWMAIGRLCTGVGRTTSPNVSPRSSPPATCSTGIVIA